MRMPFNAGSSKKGSSTPDTSTRDKSTKKKVGGLFTGVSAMALLLGVAHGTAKAQGVTVTGTTANVTVTSASTPDFIFIDGGTVTGNVTNQGSVGVGAGPATGIDIANGGSVGGSVVNATFRPGKCLCQENLPGV